jgi:anti-sigma factor RsiW
MNGCDAVRRLAGSYVDGELIGEERHALESHLAQCAACRAAFANEAAFAALLEGAVPRPAAPEALRGRLGQLTRARPRRVAVWAALAAALLLAASFWYGPARLPRPAPPSASEGAELVRVAVDSHLRYARGALPLEVRSERPEEVSRWFSGRVPFNVTLPDYRVGPGEQKFYHLEGGRLVALADDYAAYVAYRMDGRPISLLVSSADRVRPSGRRRVDSGGLSFFLESVAGLEVISWTDKGLTYALASDLGVGSERSCLICHGSPEERRRFEGFSRRPISGS